jgi:hypothetical protein
MSTSLSLSFELVSLMKWLMKHKKHELAAMVNQAVESGFLELGGLAEDPEYSNVDEYVHNAVAGFMEALESALLDGMEHNLDSKQGLNALLANSIGSFDKTDIDQKTLWTSLQQAKSLFVKTKKDSKNDDGDLKDALFKSVLENWSPADEEVVG